MNFSLRRVLLIFFSLVSLLFFLFVVVFSMYRFMRPNSEDEEDPFLFEGVNEYRIDTYDTTTHAFSQGFVSIGDELESDGYLTYRSEEGIISLISNFDSNRFVCTGECVCSDERRYFSSASSVVKRRLIMLVAAAASTVAVEISRKYFEDEECADLTCDSPSQTVTSSSVQCTTLSDFKDKEALEKEDAEYEDAMNKKGKVYKYTCKANCLPHRFPQDADKKIIEELFTGKGKVCEDLKKSTTISLDEIPGRNELFHEYAAKKKFEDDHLVNFCKTESSITKIYGVGESSVNYSIAACTHRNVLTMNKSIECVRND